MAITITQRQLRNDSGEIMRGLEAGNTYIVTRNGVPVGELRPIRKRRFVPKEELIESARRLGRIDFEQFRRDMDAVVDPYVDVREP